MHLNPESLSFALLISDLGSIARAANILGMKQATLSRKLTALESRVGVRLFDRSTRGAVPTVSGAGFRGVTVTMPVCSLYDEVRTRRSLGKDAPEVRPIQLDGTVIARSVLGGLHHHYVRV